MKFNFLLLCYGYVILYETAVFKTIFMFSCPVCRYRQTPEEEVDQTCFECDAKEVSLFLIHTKYKVYQCEGLFIKCTLFFNHIVH